MLSLIAKDVKFNFKYVVIATLFLLIAPIILVKGEGTTSQFFAVVLYFPLLVVNYIIGKFCYIEDSTYTLNFLKSLPISKYKRVGSRYLEGILLVFFTTAYCTFIEQTFFIKDPSVSLQYFSISASVYIAYLGLYLGLFYFKNYQLAQQSLSIAFIIFFAMVAIFKYFNLDLQIQLSSFILISIFIISSSLCFLSYFLVCRRK